MAGVGRKPSTGQAAGPETDERAFAAMATRAKALIRRGKGVADPSQVGLSGAIVEREHKRDPTPGRRIFSGCQRL